MAVVISTIGYFLPIFAFLLVLVVVYALLKKSEILGGNEFVMLLISFVLASFFIVQAKLVEFIQFSSAWFSVGVVVLFFIFVIMAFLPGDAPSIFKDSKWIGWAVFGIMILLFVLSAGHVFNTAINWALVRTWMSTDWFGMILLLIIAGVVAWQLKK
ncbi:hypothetical protein KAS08_03510 [Candidatus Pacearchaeota archaeon]|nr:hypothetical protein [Candidatus Pacearchaeota archaeon]